MSTARRLLARVRRSAPFVIATRLTRIAAVATAADVRTTSRSRGLPIRYWWLRTAAIGNIVGPPQALAGRPARMARGPLDLVLVAGAGADGPRRLFEIADELIASERYSTPTVLIATSVGDLDTEVAAVCRHIATDDPLVARGSRARFGTGRTVLVDRPDRWLPTLTKLVGQ